MFVNCLSNSINKLMINQVEIESVSDIKSLGVITDNKLSWQTHIIYVKRKFSETIAILYKGKDFWNKK